MAQEKLNQTMQNDSKNDVRNPHAPKKLIGIYKLEDLRSILRSRATSYSP